MRRRRLRAVLPEHDRLDRHEVLHQQVPLVVLGHGPDAVLDAQLDGAHQLVGGDLLVGHLPRVVHPSVPDLALLVHHALGVVQALGALPPRGLCIATQKVGLTRKESLRKCLTRRLTGVAVEDGGA